MIKIYTTPDKVSEIQSLISANPDFTDAVQVVDYLKEAAEPSSYSIIINTEGIKFPVDWDNLMPPYILQESVYYQEQTLTGLIYYKLGAMSAAEDLLQGDGALWQELLILAGFIEGYTIDPNRISVASYKVFDDYRLMHNQAIIRHYFPQSEDKKKVHYYYNQAIDDAPTEEYRAFSAKHYAIFLFDEGEYTLAEKILNNIDQGAISTDAQMELGYLLCQLLLNNPTANKIEVKEKLWTILQYFERRGKTYQAADVYENACSIASEEKSYAEALGYINKAAKIYKDEDLDDLYYQAVYKRGGLLHSWAVGGQVQFFKGAMESFQEVTKYFKKETHPYVFGHIQHYLGVIYSEIPDEAKKRGIWGAVSSSAFQEALGIFTKGNTPQEYAMICNSYGNALTKYPAAVLSDNYEKALYYYNESLQVRTSAYPVERSTTLLNYIDASWKVGNEGNENNLERYNDMMQKIEEVLELNANEELVARAKEHLPLMEELQKQF